MSDELPTVVSAALAATPTAQLFAIYDIASRKIIQFTTSFSIPDLSAHPDWAVRPIATMPTGATAGYMFDANFNVAPYRPNLPESRRAKAIAAQAHFDGLIGQGFVYSGKLYQIDPRSQMQLAAMSLMALGSITDPVNSPWPANFYWVAADNSRVPMDAPGLYAFGRAVAGYVSGSILHLRTIKDEIATAPDQQALDAVAVTAGYPEASA
jgi:hypothetical protein